jgi:hypothetical protein
MLCLGQEFPAADDHVARCRDSRNVDPRAAAIPTMLSLIATIAEPAMTMLRSILVLVDPNRGRNARVRVAAQLAKDHGSHLFGVAPTHRAELPAFLHRPPR